VIAFYKRALFVTLSSRMDQKHASETTGSCRTLTRRSGTQGLCHPVCKRTKAILCCPRCLLGWIPLEYQAQRFVLGTFGETMSPEHQLHWIFENCKVVRAANGISTIVQALKITSGKHDFLWLAARLSFQIPSSYFHSALQDFVR
jgi:hypothetical protein